MKKGNLVKVKECELKYAFGHIIDIYPTNEDDTAYAVCHEGDGEVLTYFHNELELYTYEDMLKELIFAGDYGTHKALELTRDHLIVDGIELKPEMAVKLAKDVLEFYENK